jgi:hypothetical protein
LPGKAFDETGTQDVAVAAIGEQSFFNFRGTPATLPPSLLPSALAQMPTGPKDMVMEVSSSSGHGVRQAK